MALISTTDQLIVQIKRRAMVPTSQDTFTNADFLEFADEELQTRILPMLLSVREEFLVTTEDIPVVDGIDKYEIPDRSVGRNLRDVLFSPDSTITASSRIYSLARLEPEQIPWQQNSSRSALDFLFYMMDDFVVLHPQPRGNPGTLRLVYHRRPNDLVLTTEAARITSIPNGTDIVVNAIPATFTTSELYDFTAFKGGFRSKGDNQTATVIDTGTNTITFGAGLPTNENALSVGDWVGLQCQSPVAQIPRELQPVLAQAVAVKCLEALGDRQGMQVAEAKLQQIFEATKNNLITPRTRGEPRKIVAANYFRNSYWDY